MLAEFQRDIAGWALRGERAPAAGWLAPGVPTARLDIHRNTVLGLLAEVLAAAYPVVREVVGAAFFEAAARRYAAADPPRRPQLWAWGGGFPEFLGGFPPAATLAYLPDLARLEWAMARAYFAADAEALDPARLVGLPIDMMSGIRLAPHPSLTLLDSPFAVHSVWAAHRPGASPDGLDPAAGPEHMLVVRPADAVVVERLQPWQAEFLAALIAGSPLGPALSAGSARLPVLLGELTARLKGGLFIGYAHQDEVEP